MSEVKNRVIRIVNGLPPEEPKVLVELGADETVVKTRSVYCDISDCDGTKCVGPSYSCTYPEYKSSAYSLHAFTVNGEPVTYKEIAEAYGKLTATPEPNPDPTGDSTPIPVSNSKPYVKFRMMADCNRILPSLGSPIPAAHFGFPKIVLN